MSIDVSQLNVNSRDYISIYNDLIQAIPNISQIWKSRDDNDPGIVLVKLMSMYGDMLSYNHDKALLELYPSSVTQRKNAMQIYNLIGYKMRWYRSAVCTATLINNNEEPAILPKFTTFITKDDKIKYTYIGDNIQILSNFNSYNSNPLTVELIQGYPRTPTLISSNVVPSSYNDNWHSVYNFNINESNIINNKIYLEDINVDESSIVLIDNTNEQWTIVDNIDSIINPGKYFELKLDSDNKLYIQLINYWRSYDINVNKFKLFYIVSAGESGQITSNTLVRATTKIVSIDLDSSQKDISKDISIQNEASTYGYNPETVDEAREESAKYINTYDTLITLSDFEKAVRRLEGVANCITTDRTNDPGTLSLNDMKIYITRTEIAETIDKPVFIQSILQGIQNNKLLPLNITVDLDSINYYYWDISGTIYLTEKVSRSEARDIIVRINNMLKFKYQPENISYNSLIDYTDLIETIKSVDKRINITDIDPVIYYKYTYDEYGNIIATDIINDNPNYTNYKSIITNKYQISWEIHNTSDSISLGGPNDRIKPGSIHIRVDNRYNITDNKNGRLISSSNYFIDGSINYNTGVIQVELTSIPTNPVIVKYEKLAINMVKFNGIDISKFTVSDDCIREDNY